MVGGQLGHSIVKSSWLSQIQLWLLLFSLRWYAPDTDMFMVSKSYSCVRQSNTFKISRNGAVHWCSHGESAWLVVNFKLSIWELLIFIEWVYIQHPMETWVMWIWRLGDSVTNIVSSLGDSIWTMATKLLGV